MATLLSYGGITFSDIKTIAFEQRAVRTPDDTTYLYDEYTIRIAAVFAPGLEPGVGDLSPAITYTSIQGCLSKNAQPLLFQDGENVLISSPLIGTSVDAKNGPMPSYLNITQLTPGSYLIEFEVKTWLYNCCDALNAINPYIANRWMEAANIDQDMYTTIVRRGKMYFRSDLLEQTGLTADDYRGIIVASCPMKPGHLRTSEYKVQEDGLVIEYTITDKQVYAVPLPPLTRFEAEYRIVTTKGAVAQEEMHVRCWANSSTSKLDVYRAAATIASFRLMTAGFFVPGAGGRVIQGGYYKDHLHENYVELHLVAIKGKFNETFLGLQFSNAAPGRGNTIDPPNGATGNASQVPNPGTRATDLLKIVANVVQDPCLNAAIGVPVSDWPVTSVPAAVSGPQPATITVVASLPTTNTQLVSFTDNSPCYTFSVMDIEYKQDVKVMQFPVASSSTTSASFATLANPVMQKVVRYTMESAISQPQLPKTVSNDPNEVLLGWCIVPSAQDLTADSLMNDWRVTGEYTYALIDASEAKIMAGRLPYVSVNFNNTQIADSDFIAGLATPV